MGAVMHSPLAATVREALATPTCNSHVAEYGITRMGGPARPVAQPRRTPDLALRRTLATNMALAVLGVVTGVLSGCLLHPAGEGKLAAIRTWPLLLGTLAMLGLDSALVYFISRDPDRGRQLTSAVVSIGLLSSMAVGGMAWFVVPFALRAQPPQVVAAARVFLLIGGIYAVVGIPHGSLRGAHSFTEWNLFRNCSWPCLVGLMKPILIGTTNER